jgi:hypothetical protein
VRRGRGGEFGWVGLRYMPFDVGVEEFHGVQLGCVAGQEVHLDLVNVFGEPVAYGDPPVDRVPVHDQVDLPVEVANEAVEPVQEHRPGERPGETGEVQLALVADRGHPVDPEAFTGLAHHRGLPDRRPALADRGVGAQPGLVQP